MSSYDEIHVHLPQRDSANITCTIVKNEQSVFSGLFQRVKLISY